MKNMDLKEMYYKHQLLWYRLALNALINERKSTKFSMLPHNDKDIMNQCYMCDYALKRRYMLNKQSDLCEYCPLDFEKNCNCSGSIYRRYMSETNLKGCALLAIQIAETPLKPEYVKESLNNDFGRNV